jgi:oxaloacetate decarboxylase gamma subunit
MAEALELMLTGMSTVFIILIMVVVLGNLIIKLTNKFASAPVTLTGNKAGNIPGIDSKKMAAIVSAVQLVTKGRGNVTSIKKVN